MLFLLLIETPCRITDIIVIAMSMMITGLRSLKGSRQQCRSSGQHRDLVSFVTKFIQDWKEMIESSQPRPNPPGTKPPVFTFRKWLTLPLLSHWRIIHETLQLYKQSAFDRSEAIRSLTRDEELLKAAEEAAAAAAAAQSGALDGSSNSSSDATRPKIDMAELLEQLRERNPQLFEDVKKIGSVEEAVKLAMDNKGEVEKVAVDRMEVMGDAIREFMVGYREGKEAGIKEAIEDDQFIERMTTSPAPESSSRSSSSSSDETNSSSKSTSIPDIDTPPQIGSKA